MDVLVYEPGEEAKVVRISDYEEGRETHLKEMQELVGGGFIETLRLSRVEDDFIVIFNEDGKARNLPPNMKINLNGRYPDVIVGTVFVCKESGSSLVGLSAEEVDAAKVLMGEWTIRV